MKTPKSASKHEKGGSALSTPTSGKIAKNKSTPMSLKTKVLEKNAKLALLKSQDTITLNGKPSKNVGTPKKGSPPASSGSKKGGKPVQNLTPKSPVVSPDFNGTAGKKRKSLEGTPAGASGKKSKACPEVSPEVKLGLKIEKLLESPKEKKTVEPASPSGNKKKPKKKKNKAEASSAKGQSPVSGEQKKPDGSPTPGSTEKKSKRQKQKEAKAKKKAQATEQGVPAAVDDKKKKLLQKVESKQLKKKEAQLKQKGAAPPESQNSEKSKSKKKAKNEKKRERRLAKAASKSRDNLLKDVTASSQNAAGSFPNPAFAANAIQAIIDDEKERAAAKPELLDEPNPILLVVDFFYHPPARGTQRIALPHPHLNKDPDVIFIATDMKKAKSDFEESIDHHTELFRTSGITSISEVLPLRKLMKEYSQLEEKRKLVNRADAFLIDAKIAHRISSLIPRKFLQKKVPIPVRLHLKNNELRKEVATALRKTTVVLKKNSLSVAVKVGHIGMKKEALADNLAAVANALSDEKMFPGGRPNVRQLHVKTPRSDSYPVYISVVPRSQILKPKAPLKKKKEIVEGEVTTAGVTVAVHPDGEIKIKSKDVDLDETEHDTSPKKKKEKKVASKTASDDEEDDSDFDDADSDDDLDPAEIEKFIKANKLDDDEDVDSSDEEGGEIEKAEQEFLRELSKQQDALEAEARKAKTAGKKATEVVPADDDDDGEESDVDDEEDELDDEEDELDDEEEEVDESGDDEEEDESDEESDDDEVPDLVPAKVAPLQKGKGGKPGQNGLQAKGAAVAAQKGKAVSGQKIKPNPSQKSKPNPAQKGKNAAQKGKNAAQKRGSFQKTKDSPKAKRR